MITKYFEFVIKTLIAVGTIAVFSACSNDTSSPDSAGILIETNTGHKGLARVYVATDLWKLVPGDTVSLAYTEQDTVGDTIFVNKNDYRKAVDTLSVLRGTLVMDSVPEGLYDSAKVYDTKGGVRSYAVDLEIKKNEAYAVDSNGVKTLAVYESNGWADMSDLSYISVSDFNIKTGDTLVFYGTEFLEEDSSALFISHFEYSGIGLTLLVDSAEVASGIAELYTIPFGSYDSLLVKSANGKTHKYNLSFFIEKERSYYIDSNGATPITIVDTLIREGKAQFYFSVESFEMAENDTLVMYRSERKIENDTLFETNYVVNRVMTAGDIAKGVAKIENVPEGFYNDLRIGRESNERGLSNGFAEDSRQWNLSETPIFISSSYVGSLDSVDVALPEGFEDLAKTDEIFVDIPFPIFLPASLDNPCLLDAEDNLIKLEASERDFYADSVLYWGKAPMVKFSGTGKLKFRIIDKCVEDNNLQLQLGAYRNHFSDAEISDSAYARFKDKKDLLGRSRWTDSTDNWFYIPDFKPFSEDGRYMGLSIWFNIDSMQVGEYAQIISAKKDSVGFTLQKRGASGAVNLRLDTRTGVYNTVVGRANGVLDGTWHNYSFKIHGDSVTTFIDGALLESKQFDAGEGFAAAFNPSIGYGGLRGGIDEVFFFDGTQSNNWMRLFCALQYAVIKE